MVLKDYKKIAKHSMKMYHTIRLVYGLKNITKILSDNYFNFKKRFNSLNKRFERNT